MTVALTVTLQMKRMGFGELVVLTEPCSSFPSKGMGELKLGPKPPYC